MIAVGLWGIGVNDHMQIFFKIVTKRCIDFLIVLGLKQVSRGQSDYAWGISFPSRADLIGGWLQMVVE